MVSDEIASSSSMETDGVDHHAPGDEKVGPVVRVAGRLEEGA